MDNHATRTPPRPVGRPPNLEEGRSHEVRLVLPHWLWKRLYVLAAQDRIKATEAANEVGFDPIKVWDSLGGTVSGVVRRILAERFSKEIR